MIDSIFGAKCFRLKGFSKNKISKRPNCKQNAQSRVDLEMNPDIILALDGICRLCLTLTEKSELVDIFDSNVALRIMGCVAVEVKIKCKNSCLF